MYLEVLLHIFLPKAPRLKINILLSVKLNYGRPTGNKIRYMKIPKVCNLEASTYLG